MPGRGDQVSTIATLAVKLRAETQDFQKNMKQQEQVLKKFGDRVGATGKTMTKWVTGPIVGAATAALGLAKNWASTGDEIAKTATKLGVSTDALQEMDYWASQNGVSTEAMERAVGRLNQRVGRAADGNDKYAEAFEVLGVSIHGTEGKIRDTEDVMRDTISALRDVEDPALRSAQASEIFGTKMARDLMPALEDGSLSLEEAAQKAHELGIVMDEEAIAAAEDFEDAWDDASRSAMGMVHSIGAQLLPIFTDHLLPVFQERVIPAIKDVGEFISGLIEWFMELDPAIQRNVGIAVGLAAALGPVLMVIGKIISVLAPVIAAFKALSVAKLALLGPIALVVAALAGIVAGIIHLWNTNEDFREAVLQAWERIQATGVRIWNQLQEALEEVWETMQETFEHVLTWIQEFWEEWGETILEVSQIIWEQITLVVETAIALIENVIQLVLAVIRGDWEEAWNRILGIGETIWGLITGTIENVFGGIRVFLSQVWSRIRDNISSSVQSIYERVESWFTRLQGTITNVWTGIRDGIYGTVNNIIGHVENMVNWSIKQINRFIDGINNAISTINRIPGVSLNIIPTMSAIDIPRLHQGTRYFQPPSGAREGLALLEKGEKVIPRDSGGSVAGDKAEGESVVNNYHMETHIHSPTPLSPSDIRKKQEQSLRKLALEWGM